MSVQLPDHIRAMDQPNRQIFRQIWERLNLQNEHWMHCIVGKEGSGKSYTALKLGEMLDPSFNADRVVFDPKEFLKDLKDGNYEGGNVYVLDESGVSLGKRTWQDRGQVKLNQALQLIRSHNVGLIFTLPRLSELDSQTKGRLQSYYEIMVKRPDEFVRGRWRELDPDRADITGNVYRKKPTWRGREVDTLAFTPPENEEMVATYEERKEAFQQQFYDEAIHGEDAGEDDENDEPETAKEIAAAIEEDGSPDDYLHDINGGTQVVLDADLIAADWEIGTTKAKRVKKLLHQNLDQEGVL